MASSERFAWYGANGHQKETKRHGHQLPELQLSWQQAWRGAEGLINIFEG
jgi:hypothetical protein